MPKRCCRNAPPAAIKARRLHAVRVEPGTVKLPAATKVCWSNSLIMRDSNAYEKGDR